MPLFGNKNKKNIDLPEVVDFSNDTWSYKGNPPDYKIQSDGFSYDIQDADGNDKNAISLGLSGMLVIVLNAKSPKIKEDEILPQFGKVIKTRNWHSMTVKEANFLVQTAIKKLTNSATSGDVFDLASYAPLEVKRVLLKTLFTISRMQLPPEFREEAEHRIIDDIVPDIFSHPDYELALLTGLIVKPDEKAPEPTSSKIETNPVLEPDSLPYSSPVVENSPIENTETSVSAGGSEQDSAFAELQKIYGRKIDTMPRRTPAYAGAQNTAAPQSMESSDLQPVNNQLQNNPQTEKPVFNVPQPNNPFNAQEPQSIPQAAASNFSVPQPNNPFAAQESQSIPQAATPNFSVPQPNNPFAAQESQSIPQKAVPNFSVPQPNNPFAGREPQYIPQPPAANFSVPQPNNPFENANRNFTNQQFNASQPPVSGNMMPNNAFSQGNYPNQNQAFPQMNPNMGNFQQYPQNMRQNMPQQMNWNTQNSPAPQFPPQGWQQNMQNNQMNQTGQYPQNNPGNNQQPYGYRQNRDQNNPQNPQQNNQNN